MFKNSILDIWKKGKVAINGWLSIPNSFTAESMSKMGWDSLTIDLQHGINDYSTSLSTIFNSHQTQATQIALLNADVTALQQQIMMDTRFTTSRYYDSVLYLFGNSALNKRFSIDKNGALTTNWSNECR